MTLRHKKMAGRPTKPHLGPVLASQPTSMWPQVLRRYLPGRWGVTLPAVPAIVHAMRMHVASPVVAEHGTVCLRNLVQGAVDKVGVIVGCADTAESLQTHVVSPLSRWLVASDLALPCFESTVQVDVRRPAG